jgi:hypothetical protein
VSLTIAEVLAPAVRDRPDTPALTAPSGTLSYAELNRAVIRRHPAVAAAAVFGLPDERLGEKVAALVQFRDSADPEEGLAAVEDLCRASLARYKVPEAWSAVDAFPLNPMGKIIRTGLAALLSRLLFFHLEELFGGACHRYVPRLQSFRGAGRAAWVYLDERGDCGLFPDDFPTAIDPAPDPDHGLALPRNSRIIITIWWSVPRGGGSGPDTASPPGPGGTCRRAGGAMNGQRARSRLTAPGHAGSGLEESGSSLRTEPTSSWWERGSRARPPRGPLVHAGSMSSWSRHSGRGTAGAVHTAVPGSSAAPTQTRCTSGSPGTRDGYGDGWRLRRGSRCSP